MPAGFEFHFCNCSRKVRDAFFRAVAHERFRYHAFIINKANLYADPFRDSKRFYEFAVGVVCDNSKELLEDAIVVIDQHGDRNFKSRLQTRLRQSLVDSSGQPLVRKVRMDKSHANNLVQLADMLCGAVAHSVTKGDSSWRDAVRRRCEARAQFWPKEKPADLSFRNASHAGYSSVARAVPRPA